ncbi:MULTISPECIES: SDR family oxidoreductase [Paraburkholderia]|jgi:3-oxoacyl-[acyl-carrier protein] reductase|uniref:Oxidoreductase n=1 Tax=Paraburkholderia caribensis TaxID=75105 RepID=A0A9Q6WMJ6_9BURK|nr:MULTISPECIES: SDR family oxidoreductase [Paraburkholderia]ALP64362.1 oxidoreductase [Paraburkholderia caribensis]AMV45396.1 oxidoreductase [Paraburkholderia caribensis]AUT54498.1 oxidoreductase [Paraburkholderia caribensis]MCO4879098.1 SDR family oxidoreductase [Paraburkholderia caribensis]MDR6385613.1 3-oxoacyl-[acyl-carrier protein] reductase [Paraburkholderia caribensis]
MNSNLQGKVAFVTGGARGIGAAVVRRLASEGATVAFTYHSSAAGANELVASIEKAGGRAVAVKADVADAAALTNAINETARQLGKIDILVNNAGVLRLGTLDVFSLEDFDATVQVNVRAVFVASKAVLAHMGEGGRIINIGSTNADRMPFAGGAVYAMSKSALQGFVQGLARDLGPKGITVNNVQPGPVNTDMNPEAGEFAESLHGLMAIPRHGKADEIAGMVAYVASPEAAFVTGANLMIDGGFSA